MLIEVHILQNHSPSNLNRDDTGSPKEAVFGGCKRARISSQCIKRSIRRSEVFQREFDGQLAFRTRSLPELVREQFLRKGFDDEMAEIAARKATGFGTDDGKERSPNKSGHYRTAQTMFLTDADVALVVDVIAEAASKTESADDLQEAARNRGFSPVTADIALFGRMITSDAFLDVEASCQFAHAISTHKVDHEFDYFTAVDDLERQADDKAGAGADMIGDVEFNSACYYKYFNVHIDGLIDNLTGIAFDGKKSLSSDDISRARQTAGKAVRSLVNAACRVTPTGKQNSFAAHQLPCLVWIECRPDSLPVSYSNAFCKPVNTRPGHDLERESVDALKRECETLTRIYGLQAERRLLLSKFEDVSILGVAPSASLTQVLDELEGVVCSG